MRLTRDEKKYDKFRRFFQSLSGKPLRVLLLIIADLLWSFSVQLIVYAVYCSYVNGAGDPLAVFRDFGIISAIIVVINSQAKCYHGNILNPGAAINRVEETRRISYSTLGAYLLGLLFLHFDGRTAEYPLVPGILSFGGTVVGFPVVRFLIRFAMKKTGIGQIRVFVAGGGRTGGEVMLELYSSVYYGYKVIGYLDDDLNKREEPVCGNPWLGRICDAPRLAHKYNVHYVICCLPPLILPKIARSYTCAFEHVLIIPSNDILPITAIYPTLIGFVSGFEFQNRVMFPVSRIMKRLLELVIAFFSVLLLMPLFAVLAVLVKLSSPGPVFYSANRLGLNGKKIKVFKFRTMYQDAESRLETMLEENPAMKWEWKKKFKLEKDPRITKIGYLLRRTSLDELPQFVNVLRGEMAIIGPRPIVQDEVKYYGDAYDFFKRVRPGITGLWQVTGRSDVDYERRVALDMFYVMNWSFWLDWYILWKTLFVVFLCRGSR